MFRRHGLRFANPWCFAAASADAGGGGAGPGAAGGGAAATGSTGAAAGDAGAGTGDFLSLVPEDIRGEAAFRDVRDVGSLARMYLNGQKLIGVPPDQIVRLPGPDDAEGWNGVYNRLGRPESPDKYAFEAPKDMPEGLTIDGELQKAFAAEAHRLGISQKQAAGLFTWWNGTRATQFKALTAAEQQGFADAESKLKTEWGQAYEQKLAAAETAVAHYDRTLGLNGELANAVKAMPAASRVALGKLFATLGGHLAEDGVIGKGGEGGEAGALSPAEAQQQINALFGDEQFMKAYMDPRAAGHADAVAKMTRLHEFKVPAAPAA